MSKTQGNDTSLALNLVLSKNDKEPTITAASFYALQVALQTMKERCQQLQQRLSAVEDENLRLRIEKQRFPVNASPEEPQVQIITLQEQIAQLTRQKSQLTHHIYMVATENKQLWTRLSKLTEANQSLGSHLTKISDTLNQHSLGEASKPNQSIQIMNSCEKEVGVSDEKDKDESLEEISLKIISSIIREKMELEQQCDQMSALQTGTLSVEDCDFTLGPGESGDQEELVQDLRKILDNLREQRDQLQKQQAGLKATLVTLATLVKNGMPCKNCRSSDKKGTSQGSESKKQLRQPLNITTVSEPPVDPEDNRVTQGSDFEYFDEDRICPLCSQFFHRSTKFEDFHSHVLTHFSDEEADFESLVANNYEVVN